MSGEHLWSLYVELRKELIESQKLRAQIIGFKIVFTSTAIGLLLKDGAALDRQVFVVPALAAICFDFLICSYSFSIKRIGAYVRDTLEPALKRKHVMPDDVMLWQEFLTDRKTAQHVATYGNLGLTSITVIVALIALWQSVQPPAFVIWVFSLAVAVAADVAAVQESRRFGKTW